MRLLALIALVFLLPGIAAAQPVMLLADRVEVSDAGDRLVAEGNVRVVQGARVLRAVRLVYERAADLLTITGPMTLTDESGAVIAADRAMLSSDLREGIAEGARLILERRFQVAASEGKRTAGRFTTLGGAIATACTVCSGKEPSWAIAADRVIHDAEEGQIYFTNARLRIFGVTVAFLPSFRMADPSLGRANGFLVPNFRNSDLYGYGVKLPYYRTLGPSADFTITPFLTSQGSAILEGEYRRALVAGQFELDGAFAINDGLDYGGEARFFVRGSGEKRLARGFRLDFSGIYVADDSFLGQFDYSDDDRLVSEVSLGRTDANSHFEIGAAAFQSLRDTEEDFALPFVLPDFTYRTYQGDVVGGKLGFETEATGLARRNGRDVLRIRGALDWTRGWVLPKGVLARAASEVDAAAWQIAEDPDPAQNGGLARVSPLASLDLRWPLARRNGDVTHRIEPRVQLVYSDELGDMPPNEDSRLVEFDETNLFAFSRFPGWDRTETGLRANVGLRYRRDAPGGLSFDGTIGQVIRSRESDRLSSAASIGGKSSDTVVAFALDHKATSRLVARALVGQDFRIARSEVLASHEMSNAGFDLSYVFLDADNTAGTDIDREELALAGRWTLGPFWSVAASARRDLTAGRYSEARAELSWARDCVALDLSAERRFTSTKEVPAVTRFALTVRLIGIGTGNADNIPVASCRAGRFRERL